MIEYLEDQREELGNDTEAWIKQRNVGFLAGAEVEVGE